MNMLLNVVDVEYLQTFHSTGLTVKTVVTGVPRFSELLGATKEPKATSCTVVYKGKHESIDALRRTVGNTLRQLSLHRLKRTHDISDAPREDDWYAHHDMFYGTRYKAHPWSIRWQLDMDKMYEYHVKVRNIARILEDNFDDVVCVFSPEQFGIVDVYVDTTSISALNTTYTSDHEAVEVFLEEVVLPEIEKFTLHGIDGIKDIFFEKRDNKDDDWIVETDGTNLQRIFALPDIEFAKTMSNDMWEIYECLGIEAARNFLLKEFNMVVSSDGNFVHPAHTMLLVDIMTFQGTIISISRYGLKKEQCGAMAKASFEESLDNFLKAGMYGEKESTTSVSASIMLGKMGRFGTGICDVRIDVQQLEGQPKVLADEVAERM